MNLDMKEIASSAVGTAGLIIATSIFLQMVTTKFMSIFERYRSLAGEYRGGEQSDPRHESLEEQITLYYKRCHILRRATCWLLTAEYVFVATIILTGLSVAFPTANVIKFLCGASLVGGLLIIVVAASFDMAENRLSRQAIDSELKDFPDLPKKDVYVPSPDKDNRHNRGNVDARA